MSPSRDCMNREARHISHKLTKSAKQYSHQHQFYNNYFGGNFNHHQSNTRVISNKTHLAEHPPIHMDGSVLNEVSHHKHVGIILSKDLSWRKHISSIENKAKSVLNRMSRFKYILDRRSLERVYMCNIRPIMEYGDAIWAGGNQTDLDRLEMVQKDAARVVTGATTRCITALLMKDVA